MTLPGVGNQTDFTRPVGVLTDTPVDPRGPGGTNIDLASSEVTGVLPESKVDAALQRTAEKGQPNGYASLDASGLIPDGEIPGGIARDGEITAAVDGHEAEVDPHSGYQLRSEKGQASGYASLDATARLPNSQIPLSGLEQLSTGRVEFSGFTRLGGLSLRVGPGRGYRKKGPPSEAAPAEVIPVAWSQTDIVLPDDALRRIGVDDSGAVVVQAAALDHESVIPLGTVRTAGGAVAFLSHRDIDLIHPIADLDRYLGAVIGGSLHSGMAVTEHGAPSLQVAVAAGEYFLAKDHKTAGAAAPATFVLWFRDGAGGWSSLAAQSAFDPDAWLDDGSGVLQAVPAGKFTNPLLFAAPASNTVAEYHVVAAQASFDSVTEAEVADFPEIPEEFASQALRLAVIVLEEGVASIASIVQAQPVLAANVNSAPSPGGFAPLDAMGQVPLVYLPAAVVQGASAPGRHSTLRLESHAASGSLSSNTVQFGIVFLRSGLVIDRMEYFQDSGGGGGGAPKVRMGLYSQAVPTDIDGDPLNRLAETAEHTTIVGNDGKFVRLPLLSSLIIPATAYYWVAIVNTSTSLKHAVSLVYRANYLPRVEQATTGTTLPAVASGLSRPASAMVFAAALEA